MRSIDVNEFHSNAFRVHPVQVAVRLYQQTATEPTVIQAHILHDIVRTLQLPLSLKYKCMSASTWKLAIGSLMSVLHCGLRVARQHPAAFAALWPDLALTIDQFLFPSSVCTVEDRGIDEMVLDESIDCQVGLLQMSSAKNLFF